MQNVLLSVTSRSHQCQTSRGIFFSIRKGLSRDTVSWMHQPLDLTFSGLLRWLKERGEKAIVNHHRLSVHCYYYYFFLITSKNEGGKKLRKVKRGLK